jgi:energy-coupling factor transporter transmembrane protein EcfT
MNHLLDRKTKSCIILMLVFLIILFMPWQLVPLNRDLNYIYRNTLLIGVVAPLLYLVIFIWKLRSRWAWILLIPVSIGLVAGALFLYFGLAFSPPAQSRYMLLYTREGKSSETIEIIHKHIFTNSWNESRHVLDFSTHGFHLTRTFKRKNLKGRWIVNKDNPFHPEGVFSFEDGEITDPS